MRRRLAPVVLKSLLDQTVIIILMRSGIHHEGGVD